MGRRVVITKRPDAGIIKNTINSQGAALPNWPPEILSEDITQWLMRWVIDYTAAEGGGTDSADGLYHLGGALDIAKKEKMYVKSEKDNNMQILEYWDLTGILELNANADEQAEQLDLVAEGIYNVELDEPSLVIDPPPENENGINIATYFSGEFLCSTK